MFGGTQNLCRDIALLIVNGKPSGRNGHSGIALGTLVAINNVGIHISRRWRHCQFINDLGPKVTAS